MSNNRPAALFFMQAFLGVWLGGGANILKWNVHWWSGILEHNKIQVPKIADKISQQGAQSIIHAGIEEGECALMKRWRRKIEKVWKEREIHGRKESRFGATPCEIEKRGIMNFIAEKTLFCREMRGVITLLGNSNTLRVGVERTIGKCRLPSIMMRQSG